MPRMKYCRVNVKSRIAGTMMTTQPAASNSSWLPSRVRWKMYRPTVAMLNSDLVIMISGMKKLFQL